MEFGTVQYDLVAYNLSSEFLYTFFRKAAKAQNSVVYTLSIKFLHILFWIKRP